MFLLFVAAVALAANGVATVGGEDNVAAAVDVVSVHLHKCLRLLIAVGVAVVVVAVIVVLIAPAGDDDDDEDDDEQRCRPPSCVSHPRLNLTSLA